MAYEYLLQYIGNAPKKYSYIPHNNIIKLKLSLICGSKWRTQSLFAGFYLIWRVDFVFQIVLVVCIFHYVAHIQNWNLAENSPRTVWRHTSVISLDGTRNFKICWKWCKTRYWPSSLIVYDFQKR